MCEIDHRFKFSETTGQGAPFFDKLLDLLAKISGGPAVVGKILDIQIDREMFKYRGPGCD